MNTTASNVHSTTNFPLCGPARIEINEVAPRDGLQIEPVVVPTDAKVALLEALSACGFARIEATSARFSQIPGATVLVEAFDE